MSVVKFPRPLTKILLAGAIVVGGFALFHRSPSAAESNMLVPAPALDEAIGTAPTETAVLAGGCFWGVQAVFQHVDGVITAVSGYAGGEKATADYETVSRGSSGHAESVRIVFDPRKISYGRILQIYFSVAHDPTELNHQGPDYGTQYRSAIFPVNAEQGHVADAYIAQLNQAHIFNTAIVTRIEPDRSFYAAEDYHQDFLTLHPTYPYIVINDMPKLDSLKRLLPDVYRPAPVLVAMATTGG